ncbi:PAS domain-containing protein [Candidatus Flexifilum breve]|uniref:PAS domain-containing protein n=1 Tax=Candidatus Flexifilum breve TaxID=3140694 RepID=UPI0031CC6034
MSDYAFGYTVDKQGNIQREWATGASLQTLTGYDRDDLARITNPYSLYQPADQVRAQSEIQAVLRGQTISSEYEIISKNGEKRWLYIRRLPIWNQDRTRVVRFYGRRRISPSANARPPNCSS